MPTGACRVDLDRETGVAWVMLAVPERRNAFSSALASALHSALDGVEADDDARAIILAGEGSAFCVGGDLVSFAAALDGGDLVERVTSDMTAFNPLIGRLAAVAVPTVAALHGAVAGGGLSLAAACDLRVCTPTTVFAPGFTGIGLPPDTGASWLLPRLIGLGRAADFFLRNRRLDADEALAIGLVNEITEDVRARAGELARQLAAGPQRALADTKRLLAASFRRTLEEQVDAEAAAVVRALHGPELRAGVSAFLSKQPPSFPR